MLHVDQAKSLVESAQSHAILLERAQTQTENLISNFLGRPPGAVDRGRRLVNHSQPVDVPAGLLSALLERRPYLRAAEQHLIAANARVGVAKAAFLPTINLTAAGGAQTVDLLGIAQRSGEAYALLGVVNLPVFDAGRRAGAYKTAKAQREELLLNYRNVINGAFRDISDALVGHQKSKEYVVSQSPHRDSTRPESARRHTLHRKC